MNRDINIFSAILYTLNSLYEVDAKILQEIASDKIVHKFIDYIEDYEDKDAINELLSLLKEYADKIEGV